jgi:hypothetical protein
MTLLQGFQHHTQVKLDNIENTTVWLHGYITLGQGINVIREISERM